ncbi:TraB/GumN family protein [Caulobacter segnis]|uniref:GumN family protein n=2 Tax=Caulobacter segnis TaxID=88688 RepID=D5VQ44_CAUST|nr:TraB/GumN family protein [Caulobacter segnis]ADG12617.1 GumN family protein [Caulobacter segnis ATCC 21756]AVQ04193.1 TraB/GumN family protein [Caulobacter segnis]
MAASKSVLPALALSLILSTSALAQTAPPPTVELGPAPAQDESAVVAELTVVAKPPGPAVWLVEKDGARLYILGSAPPLPHQLKWSSPRLEKALDKASLVLVPPEASVGVTQIASFVLRFGAGLRQPLGKSLEDQLPPDLKARFVESRTQARKGAGEYKNWKPAVAGFLLLSDFRQAAGLSEAKPVSTVERMAKARKLKVKAVGQYRMSAVTTIASKLSADDQLYCLRVALDEIAYDGAHSTTIGQDWAEGDLASVRARYRASAAQRCLIHAPGGAELLEKGLVLTTDAMTQALKRPGVTVAVVDLGFLLPANGVLDRLKAGGATITSPVE